MASVDFDVATHAYRLDGREVPSATRCLDSAGLVSYDMIRSEILERKSKVGTIVHTATQYYDEGALDWSSIEEHEEIRNRVNAWVTFRKETGFVPRRIEQRFIAKIHGMEYGMTVDRDGVFGKTEAVLELKTSAAYQPWWSIQLASYALGLPDWQGRDLTPRTLFAMRRRLAVQLLPDGRYRKFDSNEPGDLDVFVSALHIATWKLQHGQPIRRIEE